MTNQHLNVSDQAIIDEVQGIILKSKTEEEIRSQLEKVLCGGEQFVLTVHKDKAGVPLSAGVLIRREHGHVIAA